MKLGYASPAEALAHVSETPWSNWTKADYTLEQWHAACLVHIHDGSPTSKSECKLPVKTPDGALNRNGVHAAAAALAGARGGLTGVSAEQKTKAANALKRYYAQLDEDPPESLSHHGVKGMRWGVRNEDKPVGRDSGGRVEAKKQPVLSEKKQAKVEKFTKRSEMMNTKISELKRENAALQGTRNPAKLYERSINKGSIKNLERDQQRALRDAQAVQKGGLTSTQKRLIVGAVGVTAVVGVGLVLRGQQSGALNSTLLRGEAFLQGRDTPFKVNKSLSGKMSASDLLTKVAAPVNPNYRSPGGHMNCRRSTFTYELRRRGYDVHATTSPVGWGQSESGVINALTTKGRDFFRSTSLSTTVAETGASQKAKGDLRKNPVSKTILDGLLKGDKEILADIESNIKRGIDPYARTSSSSKRVLEELAKQPNGARGEVVFRFPGFGHSMAYEVVDGVPHIFDSQKGTLYNAAGKMVESKWDGFTGAEITRLDNVDLDLNFLSRWATNNRGK